MKKPIPVKISERRKALGLTQEKLGILLGVSPQAVSKWENAECLPDVILLPRLCEALRISADELLEVAPQPAWPQGTAKVCASEVHIRTPKGVSLAVMGAEAVQAVQQADAAAIQGILALLTDADALALFRRLSFTAVGHEEVLAQQCGLSAEATRDALFRLLRLELCQCDPNGYVLGANAYLAFAALTAAWLASPSGREAVSSITVSYST